MQAWTDGYVAEIGYTYGYYPEMNPLRSNLVFLNKGYAIPAHGSHCELGFGQGMSINLHAAAGAGEWHGTDFNPAQVCFAKELAQASGACIHLKDDSFADFFANENLPDFDSIALHGIWSWISPENQQLIVQFIQRKLKVGGVVYISYNTMPGWANAAPMRSLLCQHVDSMSAKGDGIVNRIDSAMNFMDGLFATKPKYLQSNPMMESRLKRMQSQNRHYLAHEYFNQDWTPMYYAEMQAALSSAKLNFVGSANYSDHIDEINLTQEQIAFLEQTKDHNLKESVRDFMLNQQFRRDYWVKGGRTLSQRERLQALRAHRVLMIKPRSELSMKIKGGLGEFGLGEKLYLPIIELLATNKIVSLGELEIALKQYEISLMQIVKVCIALIGEGEVANIQDPKSVEQANDACAKLNTYILQQSLSCSTFNYLGSPQTGGGVPINRVQMLMLAGYSNNRFAVQELVEFVWKILKEDGQAVMKEGKALLTEDENLQELQAMAKKFVQEWLPIYRTLKICPEIAG
jgi:SAM-dependent methyltransferase